MARLTLYRLPRLRCRRRHSRRNRPQDPPRQGNLQPQHRPLYKNCLRRTSFNRKPLHKSRSPLSRSQNPRPRGTFPRSLSRLRPATMRTVSKRLRLKVSWNLPQHQSQRPNPQYPQTVKRPSTLPTPMRPHNTVSPRTQVWHWITAPTASQPQYRWMPRRKHWKPRRETW